MTLGVNFLAEDLCCPVRPDYICYGAITIFLTDFLIYFDLGDIDYVEVFFGVNSFSTLGFGFFPFTFLFLALEIISLAYFCCCSIAFFCARTTDLSVVCITTGLFILFGAIANLTAFFCLTFLPFSFYISSFIIKLVLTYLFLELLNNRNRFTLLVLCCLCFFFLSLQSLSFPYIHFLHIPLHLIFHSFNDRGPDLHLNFTRTLLDPTTLIMKHCKKRILVPSCLISHTCEVLLTMLLQLLLVCPMMEQIGMRLLG
jgi:hypothetical protein